MNAVESSGLPSHIWLQYIALVETNCHMPNNKYLINVCSPKK